MSQNRGYRRDGRQNYQMNSSGHYGGRSGGQMTVNPWEGGLVPGRGSGVAGLLPTPPQTSSLLSQLSNSPEAQLALASNLLSTILRPQQQPQVPSLLSLDSMGPMGGSGGMGYRGSGYGPGRYDDPGPRRKRMDNRRAEPYNKSQQGRRNAPSRGGPPERKSGLRSPSVGKSRSTVSKPKADKKEDDTKKDKEQDEEKTSDTEKNEEDSKREDTEADGEKKRDWKDEKGEDDGKSKDTRYAGIPPSLLYCHVCKKHMWDENSFQNHLKGRTHQLMMDKLEESYKIRVELMRHEQKVAEQQREIELERMKRQGKKVNMNMREYCTMCDLHFFGNLIVHRKNDRHQQLKNYLHPRCSPCGKEFPTRVEWDHHRLTPMHLRKTAEARKSRKSGSDDEFGIEELISGKEGGDFTTEIKVRTREEEEDEIKEADKSKDGDEGKDDDTEANADGDDKDKADGETTTMGNLRFRVPKYNPDVAVGLSLLKKMTGQTCRACHRFFINSEDAKTHCRTLMHYNNFVALVKEKAKAAEAKERRDVKNEEENADKEGKGTKRTEDMSTADDEGNWKRRKVANAEDEDEDAEGEGEGEKETNVKTESKENEEEEETGTDDKEEKTEEKESVKTEVQTKEEPEDAEEEAKPKAKDEGDGEEQIWSEVDRDIGNLLDTVDGEGDGEDLNEEELLNPKGDTDSPGKGTRASRNKATRGGGSGSANKAIRGGSRKKK